MVRFRGPKETPAEIRFWSKVDKQGPEDCWPWLGSKFHFGHGSFWIKNRCIAAHRFSWMLHGHDIPDTMFVLHHCDNPGCVNPGHLFLGTHADNMADMDSKGRRTVPSGENHGMSKLDWEKVGKIRIDHSKGKSNCEIARELQVTSTTVWYVVHNRTWRTRTPLSL